MGVGRLAAADRLYAVTRASGSSTRASSPAGTVPLESAVKERKLVPTDYDVILSARELGISFGDR